jgi:hypothetical protein
LVALVAVLLEVGVLLVAQTKLVASRVVAALGSFPLSAEVAAHIRLRPSTDTLELELENLIT